MTDGIRVEGTEQFARAAKALNELGDRGVRRAVYKGFRETARPLGEAARAGGAAAMPKRGGMSARIAAARIGQTNATTGSNPRIVVSLATREGYDLPGLNRGTLRHPVFGHRKTWRSQAVKAGAFTDAFEAQAPRARAAVIRQLEQVTAEAVRKV